MSDATASASLAEVGRILVARKALTEESLARALARAPESENKFFAQMIDAGETTEAALVALLAERSGFPGVDLSKSAFLLAVLDLIPRPVAEGDQILPLSTEGGRLHIAVTKPAIANDSIDEVRFITGMEISLYVALAGPLERCVLTAFDSREKGHTIWRGHALAPDAPARLAILRPPPIGPETAAAEERKRTNPGLAKVAPAAAKAAGDDDDDATVVSGPPPGMPVVAADAARAAAPTSASTPISSSASTPIDESQLEEAIIEGEPLDEVNPEDVLEVMQAIDAKPAPAAPQKKPPPNIEIEIGDEEDGAEEEVVASVRTGPKLILVVDDEPDIIRLCTRPLQLKGYAVESALDGEAAEERLKKKPAPDLVLLDAMLPLVHGFEICQRIKSSKVLRSVQVMMMSAVYRGWRFAQDAKETYGADDFIEKPFHLADLLRRVDERLAEGKAGNVTKDSTEKLYQKGVAMLADGKSKEGRAALEAAAREDPFSPRIQFALARALSLQGDVYRAITAYERAVELRPRLFPALKNLAALYQEKGFRKKAAETLERAFASAPDPSARAEIRTQLERLQ